MSSDDGYLAIDTSGDGIQIWDHATGTRARTPIEALNYAGQAIASTRRNRSSPCATGVSYGSSASTSGSRSCTSGDPAT